MPNPYTKENLKLLAEIVTLSFRIRDWGVRRFEPQIKKAAMQDVLNGDRKDPTDVLREISQYIYKVELMTLPNGMRRVAAIDLKSTYEDWYEIEKLLMGADDMSKHSISELIRLEFSRKGMDPNNEADFSEFAEMVRWAAEDSDERDRLKRIILGQEEPQRLDYGELAYALQCFSGKSYSTFDFQSIANTPDHDLHSQGITGTSCSNLGRESN